MRNGREAVAGLLGGLAGGLLGAGVMSAGHAVAMKLTGREPAPPASEADEDSTIKVAQHISRRTRHRPLAGATPLVTVGAGAGFGAAVWLGAHAVVVPALGLAPSPLRRPPGEEALELVLHIAYGLTVGLVHRVAVRASR